MATVRTILVDPQATGSLAVTAAEALTPNPVEAVVRVHAISLNRGEVRRALTAPAGMRIGYDLAGTVEVAASGREGPPAGARVVGITPGRTAWTERAVVPVNCLAVLPDDVSFEDAATLPTAGLTAFYALRKGGMLLGQQVLVTGASGGVGHLAVQLARQAGANVVALVRNPAHVDLLKGMGTHEVVVDESGAAARAYGPYDLIVESVGGAVFPSVLPLLAPGGACVQFGSSAGRDLTFSASDFYMKGRTALYGFQLFSEAATLPLSAGLTTLARLVAQRRLQPLIDVQGGWADVGEVAEDLMDRRYPGKAVLRVE